MYVYWVHNNIFFFCKFIFISVQKQYLAPINYDYDDAYYSNGQYEYIPQYDQYAGSHYGGHSHYAGHY